MLDASKFKKWAPPLIALIIAIIALIWYVSSGRGSLDLNTRELSNSDQVSNVQVQASQKITVKCKNGESYNIIFTKDQQNYDQLVFNACGSAGAESETEM